MPIPTRDSALPAESNVSELVARTLGDKPGELPLGLFDPDAGHVRSFEFNPPIVGTKKKLGALKVRKDLRKNPAKYVSYYLATALSSLGPWDLNDCKIEEAARRVGSLSMGDTIYLLFAWQAVTKPDGFNLVGSGCGQCGHDFGEVKIDPGTLRVDELPELDRDGNPWTASNRPLAVVGLARGARFASSDQEPVRTVAVSSSPWSAIWHLGDAAFQNPDLRTALVIRGSIVGNDRNDAGATEFLVDHLWPEDVNRIDAALSTITPTPDLRVEVQCPHCEALNQDVLDWTRPDFF